jgi:Nuclease-related domain
MFSLRRGEKFAADYVRRRPTLGYMWVAVAVLVCAVMTWAYYPILGMITAGVIAWRSVANLEGSDKRAAGKQLEFPVSEALRALPDDFVVLDDLILPESQDNVDHFVVGPNGLFVIEAKNYSSEVKSRGDDWFVTDQKIHSLSQQVKRNAAAVENHLAPLFAKNKLRRPTVVPVLAFVNRNSQLRIEKPTVAVLRSSQIADFIASYKREKLQTISPELKRAIVLRLLPLQRIPDQLVTEPTE